MILLTGVTGNVGGATAAALTKIGLNFRALARTPDKVQPDISLRNEIIPGDLADVSVMREILQGVDRMLLVTPNGTEQAVLEKSVVDLATQAGVKQVVKISSIEAGPEAVAPVARLHYEVEQYMDGGIPHAAFLRPTFYMQTLFTMAQPIKTAGVLPLPLGDTKISMVDVRDLGQAAANILADDEYRDGVFPVTGTVPTSLTDIAATMSTVLGREIKYVDLPEQAYRDQLNQVLDDDWRIDAICTLFEEIKAGALDHEFPCIDTITGKVAITLEEFITDHKHVFSS